MPDDRYANLSPAEIANRHWDDNVSVFRPYRIAMTEEESFLSGNRYKDDNGRYAKDRRLVQIVGPETQAEIDHIVAKITSSPRSIEARPVDEDEDPDSAEAAVALLEWVLEGQQDIGFGDEFYMAIKRACEMRCGIIKIDFDPTVHPPFGSIVFSETDPRRVMWDPCYRPHHPLSEFMIFESRIDVDVIHERWPGSDWVKPDRECFRDSEWMRGNSSRLLDGFGDPLTAASVEDNKATIRECWYKNDRTYRDKPDEKYREALKPEDQYLLCKGIDGLQPPCGYRSPKFGVLQKDVDGDGIPDTEYPPLMMQACPQCRGDLERVDALAQDAHRLQFEKGRRLVITAPFQPNPDKKAVYDDRWPIPSMRSYPVFFFLRNVKPGRLMGPSDVWTMMPQQAAADQLDTLALQRQFEHRTIFIVPKVGVTGSDGRRIALREDQSNVYYRDATVFNQFGPNNVEAFDSSGLDDNWAAVRDRVDQKLTKASSKLDLGPAEKNTRDIPVGSLQIEQAQVEVTIEDFKRRVQEAFGIGYGIVWDVLKAKLTEEQIARLRLAGVDIAKAISGDDLPGYDFSVYDTPQITGGEEIKIKAVQALTNALAEAASLQLDPVKYVAMIGKLMNLPRSVIRDFQTLIAESQEKQEQALLAEMENEDAVSEAMGEEELALMEAGGAVPPNGNGQPAAVAA